MIVMNCKMNPEPWGACKGGVAEALHARADLPDGAARAPTGTCTDE